MKEDQAIERLRQVLRRQHKALATEDAYVLWLRRYIKALAQMPPALASEKKLEIFLTDRARVHDVSASTQNQAFNAIVYFYKEVRGQPLGNIKALRATRPAHERHAPTVAETQALLQSVPNQGGYDNSPGQAKRRPGCRAQNDLLFFSLWFGAPAARQTTRKKRG